MGEHDPDGLADRVRVAPDVGAEHRAREDRQRQAHHLVADVDGLAALGRRRPLSEHLAGCVGHDLPEDGDPVLVEGRIGEPPLARPEVALARHDPFADDLAPAGVLERRLREVVGMLAQDELDVVRMDDEIRVAADVEADDVAVRPPAVQHRAEDVAAEVGDAADSGLAARAWRAGSCRYRCGRGGGHR